MRSTSTRSFYPRVDVVPAGLQHENVMQFEKKQGHTHFQWTDNQATIIHIAAKNTPNTIFACDKTDAKHAKYNFRLQQKRPKSRTMLLRHAKLAWCGNKAAQRRLLVGKKNEIYERNVLHSASFHHLVYALLHTHRVSSLYIFHPSGRSDPYHPDRQCKNRLVSYSKIKRDYRSSEWHFTTVA